MGGSMAKERNQNWDLEAIADHESSINVMAVSEDQSVLVTGSEDCTARLWTTTGEQTECIGILRGHKNYITTIGTVGIHVITGAADNTIRKWEMATCACVFIYEGHTSRVTRILCTADFIISSSYDKTCKLWIFETEEDDDAESVCIRTFEGHTAGVYPICFIPGDAQDSATAGEGTEGQEQPEAEDDDLEDGINAGDVAGHRGRPTATARSWSVATGQQLKVFKGHKGPVSTMAIDSTGRLLYTSGPDRTVREWNIETGECVKLLEGHKDAVICMQVVNKLMYTGSADGTAKCFITEFGDCTRTYKAHRDTVICLRFHSGIVSYAQTVFTGSADMAARAFDAKSGNLKRVYMGHEAAINCLSVVGKKLYTGGSDGTLRVWDADVPDDDDISEPKTNAVTPVDDSSAESTEAPEALTPNRNDEIDLLGRVAPMEQTEGQEEAAAAGGESRANSAPHSSEVVVH